MGYARYVGRIGALAVALGVGTAVGSLAGLAWAEEGDAPSADSSVDSGASADAGSPGPSSQAPAVADPSEPSGQSPADNASRDPDPQPEPDTEPSGGSTSGSNDTRDVGNGVVVSANGEVRDSTSGGQQDEPEEEVDERNSNKPEDQRLEEIHQQEPSGSDGAVSGQSAVGAGSAPQTSVSATQIDLSGEHTESPTIADAPAEVTNAVVVTVDSVEAPDDPVVDPESTQEVVEVLTNIIDPLSGSVPDGPVDSPADWVLLAAARRELGVDTQQVTTAGETGEVFTSLTVTAAAVPPNAPPTVEIPAEFLIEDPVTGMISGKIVVTDPEGKRTSLIVTGRPTVGKFTYSATTRTFTYTPTAAQRFLAGTTLLDDYVNLTVTVSDGVNKITGQELHIPISPTHYTDTGSINLGLGASVDGVAVTNTRAYVIDKSAKKLTIVDTINRAVVGSVTLAQAPVSVAVTPDGKKVYVVNDATNVISVFDGATGAALAPIDFGSSRTPTTVSVSPNGKTLYAAGGLQNTKTGVYDAVVTKVSTATGKIIGTVKLVGADPNEVHSLQVTPDGTRVYVIADQLSGEPATPSGLYVFGSASTVSKFMAAGERFISVAVSPDSTRVYVNDVDAGVISVFNGKNYVRIQDYDDVLHQIGTLRVSSDGSMVHTVDEVLGALTVVNGLQFTGDSFSTVASTLPVATTLGHDYPPAVLSPDGQQLYYAADSGLRVISLLPANLFPVTGSPTPGTPVPTTGVTTGGYGVTDPNGDKLSYVLTTGPTKGKVVLNKNGTWTYTPTAAARHAASTVGAGTPLTQDSFVVTVSDGRRGIVEQTVTVNILPANQKPTVRFAASVPNTATGLVKVAVVGTDRDRDALTYTTTGTTAKSGTLAVDAAGKYTYTPTALARYNASLKTATPADKVDTFTVTVADNHGGVVNQVVTVKISPKSTRPNSVVTSSGSTAYTEQQGSVVVDGALTLSNQTSQFSGATATLTGLQSGDSLAFTTPGGSGISGSYNSSTGVLTLTGTSSAANYQTALRSVTFASTTDVPVATKTVGFVVTDGGIPSAVASKTISITAVNDPPSVVTSNGSTPYTEQQGSVVVDGALTVSDPDSTTVSGATASLSSPQSGDLLAFTAPAGSGITGSYNSATGVLTLSGNSSVANYQTALRSVRFTSTTNAPVSTKTVTFVVTGSGTPSAAATKTIAITAVNDTPSLAGGSGNVVVAPNTPIAIAPTITVTDPDGGNLTGATVSITDGRQLLADSLALDPVIQNGITGVYNPVTGVLTLTGTSSVANYQAALRSVTFINSTLFPSEGARTITIMVTDGELSSNTLTLTATVRVNQAPVANNNTFSTAEDTAATGNVLTNDTDSNGDELTATLGTGASHGIVNLNPNGSFTYTPNVNYHGDDSFTYTASDGFITSNTALVSLTITPVDDVLWQFTYGTGAQYWSTDARAALQTAAERISELIATSSPVTISIDVKGENNVALGYLATGGSGFNYSAPGYYDTFVAQKIITANHYDGNGANADGTLTGNFGYNYDYGDNPAWNELDFQSVMMHELLHGMGFLSGTGSTVTNRNYWYAFDEFLRDATGAKVIGSDYKYDPAYSLNLAGLNGGLYFGGPNAVAAYGGLIPLEDGSVGHLRGSVFIGLTNKVMSPVAPPYGTTLRTLSALELGILKDLGYTVAGGSNTSLLPSVPPSLSQGSESDGSDASLAAMTLRPIINMAKDGRSRQVHDGNHGLFPAWYLLVWGPFWVG